MRIKELVDLFALCRRLHDSIRYQRRFFRGGFLLRLRLFLRLVRHGRELASQQRVEQAGNVVRCDVRFQAKPGGRADVRLLIILLNLVDIKSSVHRKARCQSEENHRALPKKFRGS